MVALIIALAHEAYAKDVASESLFGNFCGLLPGNPRVNLRITSIPRISIDVDLGWRNRNILGMSELSCAKE